jgi:hypothetical protein
VKAGTLSWNHDVQVASKSMSVSEPSALIRRLRGVSKTCLGCDRKMAAHHIVRDFGRTNSKNRESFPLTPSIHS